MLFNSIDFIVFFPLVVALFFALPHRFRWMLLLAASYYFYMCWKVEYAALILASTIVDYWAAHRMQRSSQHKRFYLGLSLLSNLGMLFGFKYFNFFNDSARAVFDRFNVFYDVPAFDVLLPVGISFYTFQTLSYTIDVYRGKQKAESHFGIFALYVSFFPQLVAGPIERPAHLIPQFKKHQIVDPDRIGSGLRLMLYGFFKKLIVADRLSVYVDTVYAAPDAHSWLTLTVATIFFAVQIYCDFSGYSDIAIGASRIMGYDLMINFRRPYFSKSLAEFWRRWHISLSTWFRDYVYVSLGGNRVSHARHLFNLSAVFLISGLWHGANWTFVVWGGIHGCVLCLSILTIDWRTRIPGYHWLARHRLVHQTLQVLTVFLIVNVAWVFFRAANIGDAMTILSRIFTLAGSGFFTGEMVAFGHSLLAVGLLFSLEAFKEWNLGRFGFNWLGQFTVVRSVGCAAAVLLILLLGVFDGGQFIYFQF
ncbi:MAG: alginate O-acetyltransferase complex protein AlgI [Verrucomicrobiales bacterium]|jgi:alginate O-acetyltransferase complex protein AlgI